VSPRPEQEFALCEEVLTAVRLIKLGFRALQQLSGENTFRHLPMLTLASGFERLMKVVLCLHQLRENGDFPSRRYLMDNGHDLEKLLSRITTDCFTDSYLHKVPAARTDVEYLRTDSHLLTMVGLLSRFGKAARYYNLDVISGTSPDTDSPEQELQKLEITVLRGLPGGIEAQIARAKGDVTPLFKIIYGELIAVMERFARALCRLFTIGELGPLAKRQTGVIKDFLFLAESDLGTVQY